MTEREDIYRQADYHKAQPMEPLQNYPIGKYKVDYDEILKLLSEKMPTAPSINDPVMRELQALRKEVRSMFNYCMWVALGFSVVLLFLFLKG